MRTLAALAAFVLASGATAARAQEAPAPAAAEADEQENAQAPPKRHIQVLQHPYEISSFYRSSPGGGPVDFGYEPTMSGGRYPIAGFYRSRGAAPGGYSMFWTTGYGTARTGHGPGRGRGLLGSPRHRALGLNGDLCLFAPTFLAPVGPLTGVFSDK
jgi:hypothetical protein